MIQNIAELLQISQNILWLGIAIFLRVGPLVALLPAFGERTVPVRIKLVIALAFVLIIAPIIQTPTHLTGFDTYSILIVTETCTGVILGIGLRLFLLALQTAGSIAAQSTSLSQILGGAVTDPLPAMGYMLVIGGLTIAVLMGLHIKAAKLLIISYEFLPIGHLQAGSNVAIWGVSRIKEAFSLAFTLAAPFVILSVVYNLALGAINKAMPQLMVAFVGAPVITAGGLLVLALATPTMLSHWMHAFDLFLANPYKVNP